MRRRVALVTARAARGLDEDMPPLIAAFADARVHAEIVDWDDERCDWTRFDAVLLRSAWDYTERLPEFLGWIGRVAALTPVLNPPPVLRWSADKHYLGALARAGMPVVTSCFAEPGTDAAALLRDFLARESCAELVVKPAVGAGARDARRHARGAVGETLAHMRSLLASGRSVLLQPYYEGVDHHGETALIYIAGRFSHSIRKGALLPLGAPSTGALFAPEQIEACEAAPDERRAAEAILAALPFGELLYARVDLLRDPRAVPRLLELELCEPSLYFSYAPGSARRYVTAALARLGWS